MDLPLLKRVSDQVEMLLDHLCVNHPVTTESAAFFDIDGTLNRYDSLELLISELVSRKFIKDKKKVAAFTNSHQLWKLREKSFEDYIKDVIDILNCLKSVREDFFIKSTKFILEKKSLYYLFTWLLLMKLKFLGYKLIAISGAPTFMVETFLQNIGLQPTAIDASNYIFKDQRFTGEVDLSVVKNKGDFMLNKYGKVYDLKNSVALGDTTSDISMFKNVGKAITINPTFELASAAKEHRWPIVIERKNLVIVFPDGQYPDACF